MPRFIADYTVTYSAAQTTTVEAESNDDVARIIGAASERLSAPHWAPKGGIDVMIRAIEPETG